jgi:NUMOD3 motif
MSIVCQLCNQEFAQITNKHLKFGHAGMTTTEYKKRFGQDSLVPAELRELKSQQNSGENNPMFGKQHTEESRELQRANRASKGTGLRGPLPEEVKEYLRITGIERHRYWHETGTHPQVGVLHTQERKTNISIGVKEYANSRTPEQIVALVAKQQATKKANGIDYNAKRRSKTYVEIYGEEKAAEIVANISEGLLKAGAIRHGQTNQYYLETIDKLGFDLLNDINEHFLHIRHRKCGFEMSRTRQVFQISKVHEEICDKCFPQEFTKSDAEIFLLNYIRTLLPGTTVFSGNRSAIYPLELGIYIPSLDLAFEYCGLWYHSEQNEHDRLYHVAKYQKCRDKGIRLITIFENEYENNKEILLGRMRHILGIYTTILYARQTAFKEISAKQANKFLNQNHIQGSGRSNHCYGLFLKDELISVMTFNNSNPSRNRKKEWEINRFCNKLGFKIDGSASKLFANAMRILKLDRVISYADLRWGEGGVYKHLGFNLSGYTVPNYWYVDGLSLVHRWTLRKTQEDKKNYPDLTEHEIRIIEGWNWIWDCGNAKWIWTNPALMETKIKVA